RAEYNLGSLYSGCARKIAWDFGIRPRRGVRLNMDNEWIRAELREGKFSTRLMRAGAALQLSPYVSFNNSVQYDNVSNVLGWQFRFRWTTRPGNDIYFVYLHSWLRQWESFITQDRTATAKVVYTFLF